VLPELPEKCPCYGAGGCQPTACGGGAIETGYAAQSAPVQQSYGGNTPGEYRRLQEQQAYGQAAPVSTGYAEQASCGCPAGTIDTSHLVLSNPIMLWIAFILLFLPAFVFLCMGLSDIRTFFNDTSTPTLAEFDAIWNTAFPPAFIGVPTSGSGTAASVGARLVIDTLDKFIIMPRILAGIVVLVASLAYLTMATGHGYVVKCNGRAFYYARYIDWVITTPLMLIDLATFSGFSTTLSVTFLVSMDILMIIAGLIGELIDGSEKWAFFGISMLFFLPIIWWLCANDARDGVMCGAAPGLVPWRRTFQTLNCLTIVLWMVYPLVWILSNTGGKKSEGAAYAAAEYGGVEYGAEAGYRHLQASEFTAVGVISVTSEAWIYSVVDILAKTAFGALIVFGNLGRDFSCLIETCADGCGWQCCPGGCTGTGWPECKEPGAVILTPQGGSML